MVEVITGWHLNESVRGRFADWTQYTIWRYDCFGLDWIGLDHSEKVKLYGSSSNCIFGPHESNLRRRVDIDSLSTRTTQVGMRLWLRLRLRLRARRVALARHVYRSRQHFSINPKPAKNAFKKKIKKLWIFGYDIPCNRLCGTLWRSCFLSKLVRKKNIECM